MKYLIEYAIQYFGSGYKAECWLDENSHRLNTNVNSLEEAKKEITNALQQISKERE